MKWTVGRVQALWPRKARVKSLTRQQSKLWCYQRDSDSLTGLTEREESQTVLLFVCGDRFLNGSIKPYTDSETKRVSVFLHSAGMRVLDVGQVRANDPVWSDTSFSKTTKEAVSLEILPVGDWWGFLVSYQHRCWMQKYASLSEKCPLVAIKRGS